jgi:hypothetical protein
VQPGLIQPVVLRNGGAVDDPLAVALGFAEAGYAYDMSVVSPPSRFGEPDLRLANRGGARISAAQISAILERRRAIERALRAIAPDASLAGSAVPWLPLEQLFTQFADLHGVGFAKMTKALHKKRPALIPMLDSVVQAYLDEPPKKESPFAQQAIDLVRAYKVDLDRNRPVLRVTRRELARRGYMVTEVRLLDLMIWAAFA